MATFGRLNAIARKTRQKEVAERKVYFMTQTNRQMMRRDIAELAAFFQRHDGNLPAELPRDVATTLKVLMVLGIVLTEYPQQEVVNDILQRCSAVAWVLKDIWQPLKQRYVTE